MRCYRCGSVLSDADFCTGCGVDVTIYKKIVKISNTYYNIGLEKAKARDLSGAADILRRSVRIYKQNVMARNLLGLVYYEMGEYVQAFVEWGISKNIKPEKNIVDKYISDIQSNPVRLDEMMNNAKKYNTALMYAQAGSDDLAIIQLKGLVGKTPNYVKAAQLLGLLYLKEGQYDKAEKILTKILTVDVNNTLTYKYLAEIEEYYAKNNSKKHTGLVGAFKKKKDGDRKELSGNDVIIPQTYKEGNPISTGIVNILVGIIIGAILVFFLVTPAREKAVKNEYIDTINEYSAKIAANNITISTLQTQVEELEAEVESLTATIDAGGANAVTEYDELLAAANAYIGGSDVLDVAELLVAVDTTAVTSEGFLACYETLSNLVFTEAAATCYSMGIEYKNNGDYESAIEYLYKAYTYNSSDVNIIFYLAQSYKGANGWSNDENSKKYYQMVVDNFPDSELAERAVSEGELG